eukprot:TRINITY_DN23942_c0_g1_i1.p1 TRINITY_DN23942_c0_g1~~TRINITY_DN23942_c0_g1_i1.p1  ORF type:complete len:162 (+),score=70.57 TRINITY_DN23942_c0_g1_i1:411-896(+)
MQEEISEQLGVLERNASDARKYMLMVQAGDLGGSDEELKQVEEKLIKKITGLKDDFEAKVKELTELSKTTVDNLRSIVEKGEVAQQDTPGRPQWIVKWHNNGLNTSPRFDTESQAYQYYVNIGDFAKKLVAFDGTKWLLIKSYGGHQWTSLMTDDGAYQSG